jgi:hypothetical protein
MIATYLAMTAGLLATIATYLAMTAGLLATIATYLATTAGCCGDDHQGVLHLVGVTFLK